jgi:hypothetical protein
LLHEGDDFGSADEVEEFCFYFPLVGFELTPAGFLYGGAGIFWNLLQLF